MCGCVHERVVWDWVRVICHSEGYESIKLKRMRCVKESEGQTDRQTRHPNRPMHAHSTPEYLILGTFYPLQIAHRETGVGIEKYALLTPQYLLILVSCDITRQRPRRSRRGRQRQLLLLSMPNAAAASLPFASASVVAVSAPQYPYPQNR